MIRAQKSAVVERWFRIWNRRFLAKSFHRVHLDGSPDMLPCKEGIPLIVCTSHSSWWDLLLGVHLMEILPQWDSYAPMDQRQLERYRFFSKLGVIGVDRSNLAGAREFSDYAHELLSYPGKALWITAQGEFASTALRPVKFQPGAGAIAGSLPRFYASTAVFDYEFWSEKKPEAFISLRPAELYEVNAAFDRRTFTRTMEKNLESHLDELISLRNKRDASLFTTLIHSKSGVAPIYDAARVLSAKVNNDSAKLSHGDLLTPGWHSKRKP